MVQPAFAFLNVPGRPPKPRTAGLNIGTDVGLPLREQEDLLESHNDIIDYVKLADNSGQVARYPEEWFKRKLGLYGRYGIGSFPGGVCFELAVLQNRVNEFFQRAQEVGFTGVEISEDVIAPMGRERRGELIRTATRMGLEVYTEVGNKFPEKPLQLEDAIESIRFDLQMGAQKVTIENSDVVMLRENDPKVLLDVVEDIGIDKVIFEAGPQGGPGMTSWLIQTLGPDVNLENILLQNCVNIDAMRRGMHRAVGYAFLTSRDGKI